MIKSILSPKTEIREISLNGFDISDDTLSLLYSCANASFKTSNILDEVEKGRKL